MIFADGSPSDGVQIATIIVTGVVTIIGSIASVVFAYIKLKADLAANTQQTTEAAVAAQEAARGTKTVLSRIQEAAVLQHRSGEDVQGKLNESKKAMSEVLKLLRAQS